MVAGADGWGSPNSSPADNLLGRRARRLSVPSPGRSGRAHGNNLPAISADVRGEPASYPTAPTGGFLTGSNSFFGLRVPRGQAPGAVYNPGGPGGAYGGGWADGRLTLRDRHIVVRRGRTAHSTAPANDVALPNPQADGPPLAEYQMVNTTESWQLGTDLTTQEDNPGPHNTVEVNGQPWRRFPLGQQDGNQTHVMGPPIGEWREYGQRGPRGFHGPEPSVYATAGDGSGKRVGTLLQQGEPGSEASGRLVYGGVPHGLHSPTVPSQQFTMARQANIVQMVAPRVDRPANSKAAGQSYSQTIVPEADAGGRVSRMPRLPSPGRGAGVISRFVNRS